MKLFVLLFLGASFANAYTVEKFLDKPFQANHVGAKVVSEVAVMDEKGNLTGEVRITLEVIADGMTAALVIRLTSVEAATKATRRTAIRAALGDTPPGPCATCVRGEVLR